jgi:hypothetical protein
MSKLIFSCFDDSPLNECQFFNGNCEYSGKCPHKYFDSEKNLFTEDEFYVEDKE